MTNSDPTLYNSLPLGTIRLLRINIDIHTSDLAILEVKELKNAPPYYALSHSWGTQAHDEPVRISGHSINITHDLAAGIRLIQSASMSNLCLSPLLRYIWIDSICIDQSNNAERSLQVSMMREVYSRAIRTLIWLGPDVEQCCAAWSLVDQVYLTVRSHHAKPTSLSDISMRMYSDLTHQAYGLPTWDNDSWGILNKLLSFRWFSRLWIVQEVVLSVLDPLFISSSQWRPWYRLAWVAAWLRKNGYFRLHHIPEGLRNVDAISIIRRSLTKWPLDALLSIIQVKFHATDQRDKIFGLLGLAAECQDASSIPEPLRPNYDRSTADLYQAVTRFLLENNGSMAPLTRTRGTNGSLSRRQRRHYLGDMPSWVIDWSDFCVYNRDLRKPLTWNHYSDPSKQPWLGFPSQYNASAGNSLKIHPASRKSILHIECMGIDEITKFWQFNVNDVPSQEFNRLFSIRLGQVWHELLMLANGKDETQLAQDFVKATTAEHHSLSGCTSDSIVKDGREFLRSLARDTTVSLLKSSGNDTRCQSKGGRVSSEAGEYEKLARNFCFNRCFFFTSAGRMGIGPSDTQAGDEILLIPGGGVPYIARKDVTGWLFVGESYVQNLMDGHVFELQIRNGRSLEIFNFH